MNHVEAAIRAASAIGSAAGVPVSNPSAERLAAFWLINADNLASDGGAEDFNILVDRMRRADTTLKEIVGSDAEVSPAHLGVFHSSQEKLSERAQVGPTRFCASGFPWIL